MCISVEIPSSVFPTTRWYVFPTRCRVAYLPTSRRRPPSQGEDSRRNLQQSNDHHWKDDTHITTNHPPSALPETPNAPQGPQQRQGHDLQGPQQRQGQAHQVQEQPQRRPRDQDHRQEDKLLLHQVRIGFLREGLNGKKRFLSGIARIRGEGGSTHARIFWPSF